MKQQSVYWLQANFLSLFLLVCGLMLLLGFTGYGQSRIGIGNWQVHAPYQQGRTVAEAGDKVYCASEWGLFFYDKEFNSTETISKVDGLQEQRISAIRYDDATKTLVIAYANTNIDLLRDNKIVNISDILRKTIAGEKRIHHIYIHDKLAYLSTSFGVVVLDLVKLEIKDTYSNLGPNGEIVNVSSAAVLRDSIYLSTDLGLFSAGRTGTNLQDFASWRLLTTGLPTPDAAQALVAFNGSLYAGTPASGLFKLNNQVWHSLPGVSGIAIGSITASESYLAAVTPAGILLLNKQGALSSVSNAVLQAPTEAVADAEGNIWAADGRKGLVRIRLVDNTAEVIAPNGPFSNRSFAAYAGAGKVYVLSGGYDNSYLQQDSYDGFYVYDGGEWSNYNRALYPSPQEYINVKDLVSAVYNPVTDKVYMASYGNGLLEWGGPGSVKLYNGTNSTLLSTLAAEDQTSHVRVTDVAVDSKGSVWVVNRNGLTRQPGLHELTTENTWKSYLLPVATDGSLLHHIVVDDNNFKWLSISRRQNTRNGIYVYDEAEQRARFLTAGAGNGGLPNASVHSIVKDRNGDIWVGTAGGVGVYYNPAIVFSSSSYDARVPIIDRRPLLDGQLVRSIAVDGANRKWMGTESGVWVFNPDGTELVHHFTSRNSPLPSDNILSIAIEHQSGEVFFATDAGIASYRSGATITEGTADCAVVFPNPVRPEFTGLIGVSGLANNAQVRITDINGTLVYRGHATGGTLTWDARGYNGKRVKAGVYLVLSSDAEGKQACVSKIAILD